MALLTQATIERFIEMILDDIRSIQLLCKDESILSPTVTMILNHQKALIEYLLEQNITDEEVLMYHHISPFIFRFGQLYETHALGTKEKQN